MPVTRCRYAVTATRHASMLLMLLLRRLLCYGTCRSFCPPVTSPHTVICLGAIYMIYAMIYLPYFCPLFFAVTPHLYCYAIQRCDALITPCDAAIMPARYRYAAAAAAMPCPATMLLDASLLMLPNSPPAPFHYAITIFTLPYATLHYCYYAAAFATLR